VLAKKSSTRVVTKKDMREADVAREALCAMRDGLDSARRLVERTRFLLAGDARREEKAVALAADAQAAAPTSSETVQNPSGE
jgi:hypothetical protein